MTLFKKMTLVTATLLFCFSLQGYTAEVEKSGEETVSNALYNLIPSDESESDSLSWVLGRTNEIDYEIDPASLPPSADFSDKILNMHIQGNLGACTGHAITSAMEYNLLRQGDFTPEANIPLSALFVYFNERVLMGTVKKDSGSSLADGIRSICTWGACKNETWPYSDDLKKFKKRPSEQAYLEGENYKNLASIPHCRVKHDLSAMKSILAKNIPIVIGIYVYKSFESQEVRKTGILPIPKSEERKLGGHAMMLAGYDDEKGMFKALNSYGRDWGDGGFCWLSYDYVMNKGAKPLRKYFFNNDIWLIDHIGKDISDEALVDLEDSLGSSSSYTGLNMT